MKTKKPNIRQLTKELKELNQRHSELTEIYYKIAADNRDLKAKLQARLDDRQLEQRNKLASSLGQMIEATSKAISFIVGKEVM